MKLYLFVLSLLFTTKAFSYSELVTHGYNQCATCHVSTNGGFILTPYGRELSSQLLTQNGNEGEGQAFQGLYKNAEWFNIGGHLRTIQIFVDNPKEQKAHFFPMQFETDFSFEVSHFLVAGSAAVEGGRDIPDRKFISPQHWVQSRHLESTWFRAGRFEIPFGINTVNHTSYVKSDLYFGPDTQPYGVDVYSNVQDKVELQLGSYFAAKDARQNDLEKGYSANIQVIAFEGKKFGVSAAHLEVPHSKRDLVGISGFYALTESLVFMHENDFQKETASEGDLREGTVHLIKLDKEITRGVRLGPVYELSDLDHKNSDFKKDAYGFDFMWLPRPHYDLLIGYRNEKDPSLFSERYHKAYMIFHYWL